MSGGELEAATMERVVDAETAFLASNQETGFEWELFKENVRPLKRGRNIRLLNDALASHNTNHLKNSLLETRRFVILLHLFSFCSFYLYLLF